MATITKPMALDESFNTTESTSRNQADVLAGIESAIRQGFGRSAADVSYDNTTSGLTADDVQEAIDELADEKVDKVAGKGLSTNDFTDEDKEALDNMEFDIAGTQTVSGNPLTLTDAAPINVESLVVEFSPKQDLHGQSAPYVGGAGKNKLPMTVDGIKDANTSGSWSGNTYALNNVTFTIETDGDNNVTGINIGNNGSSASAATIFVLARFNISAGSYILNGAPTSSGLEIWRLQFSADNQVIDTGEGANIILSSDYQNASTYIRVGSGKSPQNVMFYPMIRLSTETDPTFAPYSNICPITGYTECEVDDVGFNQWDEEWEVGSLDTNGAESPTTTNIRSKNYIKVTSGTSLNFYCGSSSVGRRIAFYDANKSCLSTSDYYSNTTITMPANCEYIRFAMFSAYGVTYNHDISINYPSTITEYVPYHSSNATIQFGQTVYGGTDDVTNGVLTVDKGNYSITENTTISRNSDYSFYFYVTGIKAGGSVICDRLESSNAQNKYDVFVHPTLGAIRINTADPFSTGDALRDFLLGAQFVFDLSEPFTIQLTPQELKLLKGTNNLTTNGTTINLGYQPDNVIGEVKGEIEKCAVDAEFMQFTDGTDTFTDVNLSLDALSHTVSVVGSKIEQKRFICFEVMDKMGGVLQGILASCIAFTDGAKTPSGTAFRAYIESLQMYVNFRIYGSGGSYTLAYQSESSFSASAFYVRVRLMNNL